MAREMHWRSDDVAWAWLGACVVPDGPGGPSGARYTPPKGSATDGTNRTHETRGFIMGGIQDRLVGAFDTAERWGRLGAVDPAGLYAALRVQHPTLPAEPSEWMWGEVSDAFLRGTADRFPGFPWLPQGVSEGTACGDGCGGVWRRVPGSEVESDAHRLGCVSLHCDGCGCESADFWTVTPGW